LHQEIEVSSNEKKNAEKPGKLKRLELEKINFILP
jgi:hypothetical protein